MENAIERNGNFSASRISELLSEGTGVTRRNYILDLAINKLGIKDDFDSSAMRHGTVNQRTAFDMIRAIHLQDYPDAQWTDTYIPITKDCGASPDIILDGKIPYDVKCPYYIDTFLEQIAKVPNKYYYQIQMQCIATGGDKCGIGFFLTKPELFGDDSWEEYPFPVEQRTRSFMYDRDEEVCDRIITAVEKAVPERELYYNILRDVKVMDVVEYFNLQLNYNKFRDLKRCGNLEKAEIIRVGDKFYYKIK